MPEAMRWWAIAIGLTLVAIVAAIVAAGGELSPGGILVLTGAAAALLWPYWRHYRLRRSGRRTGLVLLVSAVAGALHSLLLAMVPGFDAAVWAVLLIPPTALIVFLGGRSILPYALSLLIVGALITPGSVGGDPDFATIDEIGNRDMSGVYLLVLVPWMAVLAVVRAGFLARLNDRGRTAFV